MCPVTWVPQKHMSLCGKLKWKVGHPGGPEEGRAPLGSVDRGFPSLLTSYTLPDTPCGQTKQNCKSGLTGKSGPELDPGAPLWGSLFLGSLGFTSPNFHLLEGDKLAASESGFFAATTCYWAWGTEWTDENWIMQL